MNRGHSQECANQRAISGKNLLCICGADISDALPPPKGLSFIGLDFANGPDKLALAVCQGAHVVLTAGETVTVDRAWLNDWSAKRKHGREVLALIFEVIATNRGATVEKIEGAANPGFHGQSIDLRISCNGVGVMLDIDNIHGGDTALLHWHNIEYPARNFTSRFCAVVGSSSSAKPHHKATSFPADWYSLAMQLDGGLMLAARGAAFVEASAT